MTASHIVVPTQTVLPTATPVVLSLKVTDELINCRFGPGTLYALINELHKDDSARVVGRNDTSTWWYVRDPGNPNGFCWLAASVTKIDGDADSLPIIQPPVTVVTGMDLTVDPQRIAVECTKFPQTFFFEAEVSANGPTLVNLQWEASTGMKTDIDTLVFDEAGTKTVNQYYQVSGPNDYWVKLHILNPNMLTKQINFVATCSP